MTTDVLAASSRVLPAASYDCILLAGFGGPEGQDDVIPYLRNVTRGRGIPDDRLVHRNTPPGRRRHHEAQRIK